MAQSALVEARTADGLAIIEQLVGNQLPIALAAWVEVIPEDAPREYDGQWWFFLVSPLVDERGPVAAYRSLSETLRNMPNFESVRSYIPLSLIRLLGENDPIAKDLFKIGSLSPSSRIRLRGM